MALNDYDGAKNSPLLEYGIMKAVLQELPNIQQLNTAAKVCKSWNEVARIIKKTRHQIYQASHPDSHDNCEPVEQILGIIKSQPYICIAFLTHEGMGEIPPPLPDLDLGVEHSKLFKGRCTEYRLLNHLKKKLPQNCVITGGIANGVIMSNQQTSSTVEIEEGDAYSLLLIPEMPGVTVKSFYFDRMKMKKLNLATTSQPEQVNQLLNVGEPDETQCLIVLGTDPYKESKCLESLFRFFQDKINPNVAIAGGFVEAVVHPDVVDGEREYGFMGLAFGGRDVKASSVVLTPDVICDKEIEKIIIEMKKKHLEAEPTTTKRKSVAFMFACVARGVHVHGRPGVESSLFRKHFPDTPLLGFFGNGEIGVNVSPAASATGCQEAATLPQSSPSAPKRSRATYLHSYSTIFAVISFPG